MFNVPNLLALSLQIGMLPTQLQRTFSLQAQSLLFFFFYFFPLMITTSCCSPEILHTITSHLTFFSLGFYPPLCYSHLSSPFFWIVFCLSFHGSPASASSYCGSGERGSQSRESARVGVRVSWWKPPSHSPLDQGKSSAPSVEEALSHAVTPTKRAISAEELAVEASHC